MLAAMPAGSSIEKRDRALVAFTILSGARDSAIASLRLKHVDLRAQTVFQDGREVNTKRRKTFTSTFFPVGAEPLEIVRGFSRRLLGGRSALRQASQLPGYAGSARRAALPQSGGVEGVDPKPRP